MLPTLSACPPLFYWQCPGNTAAASKFYHSLPVSCPHPLFVFPQYLLPPRCNTLDWCLPGHHLHPFHSHWKSSLFPDLAVPPHGQSTNISPVVYFSIYDGYYVNVIVGDATTSFWLLTSSKSELIKHLPKSCILHGGCHPLLLTRWRAVPQQERWIQPSLLESLQGCLSRAQVQDPVHYP